ncbi:unnamed protein product, partial [Iphiclides podalirius]
MKARKYVVKNYFNGVPKIDDYELVEYEVPPLQDKEFLVKVEWISVDPSQRAHNQFKDLPYDQFGYQVGIVQESKDINFPVGVRVVSRKGWSDYTVIEKDIVNEYLDPVYRLPDLKGLSPSLGIGAVGMPGAAAYFGLLEICKPKPGETVVVTSAAGAVGSIVGQIARIKGCKVIGFAGSDDKVQWLEKELGFNKAINYKTVDVSKALREAAPGGVDCYFDNIGGEISSIIISQMNKFGRITVCGCISSYNEDPKQLPKATILQPALLFKELTIRGFLVWSWYERWPEAFSQLVEWIKSGKLKVEENVTNGFENIFNAFVGVLAGENKGKTVVKI